jgi:hypothetical protein
VPEVRISSDFVRVRDLPRRQLDVAVAADYARELTALFRLPGSTHPDLKAWQGFALVETFEQRGAFLALPVGEGKTAITYLLPLVLGAKRPLLIVPGAGLRDKTHHEFGKLRRDWREPATMPVVKAWQELTTDAASAYFEALCPDLIMIDEGDEGANPDSSWCRRIDRHVQAHPDTVVVILTGTPGRKSIMDYWHLLGWALRGRAPIPMVRAEASTWALALDLGKPGYERRWKPGPLGSDLDAAREWYQTRLAETPGVVIVDGDSCDAPLTVRVRIAREDPRLDTEFAAFFKGDPATGRNALETPDGIPVSDPLSRWRIEGQLSCGLFLRWNPRPPEPWREARKSVAKFVRDRIAQSAGWVRPLDTELQVTNKYREHPVVARWLAIRDTFRPNTEAVWVSDSVLHSVVDWLRELDEPGIVWTGCVEFAIALAQLTGLSYYGAQGKDQHDRALHVADPTRHLIASWYACKRGYNLQPWTRQLFVMPPPSAKWLEQAIGRSHRRGQERPVIVDWLATSGATLDLLDTVEEEAAFAQETIGMTQKILRADVTRVNPVLTQANKYRWGRAKGHWRPIEIAAGA